MCLLVDMTGSVCLWSEYFLLIALTLSMTRSRLEPPTELHYFLKHLLDSAASSSEKCGCLSSVVSLTAWQGLTCPDSKQWERGFSCAGHYRHKAGVEEEECSCASWIVLAGLCVHPSCKDLPGFAFWNGSLQSFPSPPRPALPLFPIPPCACWSHCLHRCFWASEQAACSCLQNAAPQLCWEELDGWQGLSRGFIPVLNHISKIDLSPDLGQDWAGQEQSDMRDLHRWWVRTFRPWTQKCLFSWDCKWQPTWHQTDILELHPELGWSEQPWEILPGLQWDQDFTEIESLILPPLLSVSSPKYFCVPFSWAQFLPFIFA